MARSSASAALLLVLLSLLAFAHCRAVAVAADHAAEPQSTAAVAVRDENGLSSNSHPTLPAEAGASATEEEEVLPAAEQQKPGFEFLRLPSHRLHRHHRPCSHHRHHGVYRDAPRRFHDHYSGHGERREDAVSHLAVFPAEEAREAEEVKPVAEPDPDRSVPDSDGEGDELMLATTRREPFAEADGHDDEHAAAVREVLRRWFHFHSDHGMRRHRLHHGLHHDEEEGHEQEEEAAPEGSMDMMRFHFHRHDEEDEEKNMMRKPRPRHAENGMRHHRLHHVHHDEEEEGHDKAAPEGVNMKRFHFRHHHDEEDEEKNMMGKRLRHAEHGEEDEQVEEMVRRFRKAIMRRRFGHGHGHGHGRRFFHHDHRHRHGEEQSGVMAWIKGLMNMNRF